MVRKINIILISIFCQLFSQESFGLMLSALLRSSAPFFCSQKDFALFKRVLSDREGTIDFSLTAALF